MPEPGLLRSLRHVGVLLCGERPPRTNPCVGAFIWHVAPLLRGLCGGEGPSDFFFHLLGLRLTLCDVSLQAWARADFDEQSATTAVAVEIAHGWWLVGLGAQCRSSAAGHVIWKCEQMALQ